MASTTKNQWSITKSDQDTHLLTWIEAFLIDRKAQGFSAGTLYFYQKKLALFADICDSKFITQITQLTAVNLREFMLYLEETHHNEGGRHACFRAVKTFLYWWEAEVELDGWANRFVKRSLPKCLWNCWSL